jgi:hypothetical protein
MEKYSTILRERRKDSSKLVLEVKWRISEYICLEVGNLHQSCALSPNIKKGKQFLFNESNDGHNHY